MKDNQIEFRKKRDFGEVINATFTFITAHLIHFLSMQVLISLPFALIAIIIIKIFPVENLFFVGVFTQNIGQNILYILIYAVAGFSLLVFLVSAVYQYIALYMKKGTTFSITDLWQAILGEFWTMAKTYLFFFLGIIAVYLAIAVVAALVISVLGGFGGFLGGVLIFCGVIASIYYAMPLSFVFVIRSFEPEKTFFQAIKRANYLVKDNWWACFGLSFVMSIIQYILMAVLKIPFAVFGLADITQVNFTAVASVAVLIELVMRVITSFLPTLAGIFQYFSLVEMKDATGLTEKVEKFGTLANNDENEDEKEDF